jgi:hypothetical protein
MHPKYGLVCDLIYNRHVRAAILEFHSRYWNSLYVMETKALPYHRVYLGPTLDQWKVHPHLSTSICPPKNITLEYRQDLLSILSVYRTDPLF